MHSMIGSISFRRRCERLPLKDASLLTMGQVPTEAAETLWMFSQTNALTDPEI